MTRDADTPDPAAEFVRWATTDRVLGDPDAPPPAPPPPPGDGLRRPLPDRSQGASQERVPASPADQFARGMRDALPARFRIGGEPDPFRPVGRF